MLKALNIWALRENAARPAGSLFAEARRCGFGGVEPVVGEEGLLTLDTSREGCHSVAEAAAAAGLELTSLASGLGWKYPLTAESQRDCRRAVEVLGRSLQVAAWLGVDVLLVVPGTLAIRGAEGDAHVPYDVAMERMKDGIAELVPDAERLGVTMGIENVWNRVLLSPLEMRDFIDGFDSECVGAYVDVGNMILFGYAEDWLRILGPRVACVHFKDFKRQDGGGRFCDLLEGDVNYPAVMETLRDIGYEGPCVAEFFGLEEDALRKLSEAMDRILAM